ncbi:PREDICTED: uncharacterized protein LOC104996352 [Bison bison bison]|uniref:Uncharacterized protein LOC104996352 n=1 Tax=Bison bison bison TaxID=43346 RepID=A0A6P3IDH6_BISBB|nr:PREDICTED: uncharacterized protein LOC104996352 [Bison bison bison]
MECGEAMGTGAPLGQGPSAPTALTDNPQAQLTVVVEVERTRSGPKETCFPTLLLEGAKSIRLLWPGPLESQEQCITFDRVLGSDAAQCFPSSLLRAGWVRAPELGVCLCLRQEAEQELLARVRPTLGSVGRGYSVALLLRGRETEAPRLVPQLLQMLFEEALPLKGSDAVLSTLSLVQLSTSGRIRDLLTPGAGNLSVLDVAPLGLVVENASEVEVSDSRAASELYLRAACEAGRDCPLLQVLAGNVAGEEVEGSLTWIASWLLEGNNYSGLLLRLDPQGNPLSLFQSALLGAAERRRKVKHVRPTLWDAVEEARARRAGLKSLRSGLLGDALTDSGLSQLGRALRELHVSKVRPGVYNPLERNYYSVISALKGLSEGFYAGTQAQQAPDVALHFFLAQAQRHRLREQHQVWIQEELKHMQQEEEVVAGDQVKGLVAEEDSKERQRWHREQTVLRCQLDALQAERDAAEQDLTALYDLHVQAARAQTCHVLQVFRAWRGLCEEQAMTTEHHYRSLLAGILQDSISLATQNQELQAQNKQLQQTGLAELVLDTCPEEKSGDQESNRGTFFSPHL